MLSQTSPSKILAGNFTIAQREDQYHCRKVYEKEKHVSVRCRASRRVSFRFQDRLVSNMLRNVTYFCHSNIIIQNFQT
jgi:hypothetical protein